MRVSPKHREPNLFVRLLQDFFRLLLLSPAGGLAIRLSKTILNPRGRRWVEIEEVCLTLPRLDPRFHGYRIAQISDFHIGTWLTGEQLLEAVSLVNSLQPDLVAITGDFVTYEPRRFTHELVQALSQLAPRDCTVAVLGNHDHWTDPEAVKEVLRRSGIHELSNRAIPIEREGACLWVAGVDCHYDGLDRLDLVLEQLPAEGAALLLAHEPDFAEISALSRRFDLQLSGHSHGGQIRLPFIGPPFLPRLGRKYPAGLYRAEDMYIYTNRGLGTAELALRWNCRPEITLITLQAQAAAGDSKDGAKTAVRESDKVIKSGER